MHNYNDIVIPANCYLCGGMLVPKEFFNRKKNDKTN